MSKMVKLTISLVVYNNALEEINSIIDEISNLPVSHHFYVLDNSPYKMIPKERSNEKLTIIHSKVNVGFGRGHNICLREAEGLNPNAHLFINPDVSFKYEDVLKLYEFLVKEDRPGLVCPAVYYPDGSFQYVCRTFPNVFQLTVRLLQPVVPKYLVDKLNYKHEMRYLDYSRIQNVPVVNGCFFMVDFGVLRKVGYFDERFFLYFEDIDLCRRVSQLANVMFFPEVRIMHVHNRASRREIKLTIKHIISAFKYFWKWRKKSGL